MKGDKKEWKDLPITLMFTAIKEKIKMTRPEFDVVDKFLEAMHAMSELRKKKVPKEEFERFDLVVSDNIRTLIYHCKNNAQRDITMYPNLIRSLEQHLKIYEKVFE